MLKILIEITKNLIAKVVLKVKKCLVGISDFAVFILPFVEWYMVVNNYDWVTLFFTPIVVVLLTYYMREYANRIGYGNSCPVPAKRFTEEKHGEVFIDRSRMQELIIYVNQVEDWLEKNDIV